MWFNIGLSVPERQNPRSATTEGFEGSDKVGISNPVRQHCMTMPYLSASLLSYLIASVARDGYTNGIGQLRRVPALKLVIKKPCSDLPLSTWPMKLPLAVRFSQRIGCASNRRGNIEYLVGFLAGNAETCGVKCGLLHGGKRGSIARRKENDGR